MRIYTSYFANIKTLEENNIYPVGICNKVPQFFENPNLESVAPSNSILYEYKNSAQTDADRDRYKERYINEILCAYRLFLPYVGITVSSREEKHFRDGIVKIAATKVSAGVSTGIGDHESKYNKMDSAENASKEGDEQFEIADERSFDEMYQDIEAEGLQPVLNDYVYV